MTTEHYIIIGLTALLIIQQGFFYIKELLWQRERRDILNRFMAKDLTDYTTNVKRQDYQPAPVKPEPKKETKYIPEIPIDSVGAMESFNRIVGL
jgi:hypothetical protein